MPKYTMYAMLCMFLWWNVDVCHAHVCDAVAINCLPYMHEIKLHVMNVLGVLRAMDVLTGVLQYTHMMFH